MFSYDPVRTDRDHVRMVVGDVNSTLYYLTDEEIDWLLTATGNRHSAAAEAAEVIANRFGIKADTTLGNTAVSYARQADHFTALSKRLRKRAGSHAFTGAYAGGLTRDDILANRASDVIPAHIRLGIHDIDGWPLRNGDGAWQDQNQ